MTAALVQKLSEIRDLKGLVETTVNELGVVLNANCTQILLANPLDPNSAVIFESSLPPGSPPLQYQDSAPDKYSRLNLPLDINGRGFGTLSLSRNKPWLPEEIDSTQVLAGKIGGLIRQAQLNDIAQRETFRETFLVEINNLMTYSLGVGDALFMVVNILGKALRCSRCLFVCTDDKNAGWKCYEYWQQDKVKSCRESHWPNNDSALIAQTLSSPYPLDLYEGQANSYLTPTQAELQFSGTKSLLSVPLLSDNSLFGCLIVQQCDYRRHWTVDEIDTVQNVADRVAEALARLPEEKRIHKPIMQLHQRIVGATKISDSAAAESLVQSLTENFGNVIESRAVEPIEEAIPESIIVQEEKQFGENEGGSLKEAPFAAPNIVPVRRGRQIQEQPVSQEIENKEIETKEAADTEAAINAPSEIADEEMIGVVAETANEEFANWGITEEAAPAEVVNQEVVSAEVIIETPEQPVNDSWGDLNSIPTPSTGPVMSGLQGSMLPKVKAQAQNFAGPVRAYLNKQKTISNSLVDLPVQKQTEANYGLETPEPVLPTQEISIQTETEIDTQAREKVEEVLAKKTEGKTSSEYIFAVPNIDMRTRGRINGWVEAIEQKDKYLTPHAIHVAEYACLIAKAIHLPPEQIGEIRLAALVHDVGKLGIPGEILQKPDDQLDDAELLTTMRHPIDGAALLNSSASLAHLAPIVLAHHEEFDGNGYPSGLKGDEIPLGARIIYLANSYHSMVEDTKVSKGISAQEALEEITKETGKQYDPVLVNAFIGALNA